MGATKDWSSVALIGTPSVGLPVDCPGVAPLSWNPYSICDDVTANTKLSRITNVLLIFSAIIGNTPCRCDSSYPTFRKLCVYADSSFQTVSEQRHYRLQSVSTTRGAARTN